MRHWWAQALAGLLALAVAVNIGREPHLFGIIKVPFVVLSALGGFGLLWSAASFVRSGFLTAQNSEPSRMATPTERAGATGGPGMVHRD